MWKESFNPLVSCVVAERIPRSAVSLHRDSNIHTAVHLCIRDRNSYRIVGLAGQGNVCLNGLSGGELNGAGGGKIGDAWIKDGGIAVELAAGNGGSGVVVHPFIGRESVRSGQEFGEAEFAVGVCAPAP